MKLQIKTPRWALPLLAPKRYKGVKGGRGSGKSHERAESLVEAMILNPDLQVVCIREIQKSLKFSSKKLIGDKIRELGVSHLFDITLTEIRRIGHEGIIIFQGMQDHTADSIKSLEGFNIAWVEEAQSISKRSMELLLPTIRAENSEIWFTWNPDQESDPVECLFRDESSDSICIHVNYTDNPFLPETLAKEAERHRRTSPDTFDHVWLGGYNTRSESQIFNNKFRIADFEPLNDWTPYHGIDWGFSQDPTTAVRVYLEDSKLYIYKECGKVGLELDDTPSFIKSNIPDFEKYISRADSARPETISHCRRKGLPMIQGVDKWKGSVEDGITFMKSVDEIIIHPSCTATHQEFRLYSYKVDKKSGDILPDIVDDNNHYIDAIRYALAPLIKQRDFIFSC